MTGHIRRRGERSFELKFDIGRDPSTGKRGTRYVSFKGTKREAEAELVRLQASVHRGDFVDPSKLSVQELLEKWLERPRPDKPLSPKTRESYTGLLKAHVYPNIGDRIAQKLQPDDVRRLYERLATSGNKPRRKDGVATALSPRTIRYVHALLKNAFGYARELKVVASNPLDLVKPPARVKNEVECLEPDQIRDVLLKLQGKPMFALAALALGTGMRRSEMLALRWMDIDFDNGLVTISRAIEQTKGQLRIKAPKTEAGLRTVALPKSILSELRAKWAAQSEQNLALGLGKPEPESLVFAKLDGSPLNPNSISTEWRRLVRQLRLPPVRFHALRHSHATHLLRSGMDILSVAKQLGHADATVTLTVYAHTQRAPDNRPAELLEQAFNGATDTEQRRTLENPLGGNPVAKITRLHQRRGLSN